MKTINLILIIIVAFSSCTNYEDKINADINQIIHKFNINADVEVLEIDSNIIEVNINFNKPYKVKYEDFNNVFVFYIAQKIYSENKINKSLKFVSRISENPKLVYTKTFNLLDFNNNSNTSNSTYLKLLEYCFTNFKEADDYGLQINMESISIIFSKTLKNENLFKILYDLSLNKKPSLDNNADKMIILYHDYNKFIINGDSEMTNDFKEARLKEIHYLEAFWKIAKGTDINSEQIFLKQAISSAK